MECSVKRAEKSEPADVFKNLSLFIYGYASMLAYNDMEHDGKAIAAELENVLYGAVAAATLLFY